MLRFNLYQFLLHADFDAGQPFPSNLKHEQLKDLGAFVPPGGRITPLFHGLQLVSFYPGVNHRKQLMPECSFSM